MILAFSPTFRGSCFCSFTGAVSFFFLRFCSWSSLRSRYSSRLFCSFAFFCSSPPRKPWSSSLAALVCSFSAWASRISLIVFSTCRPAWRTISSASRLASARMASRCLRMSSSSLPYFSVSSVSSLSLCFTFCSFSSRARRFLAILLRLRSIPTNSSPARLSASLTMGSGSFILRASSKAKELPGRPISSLNMGSIFEES